MADDVFHHHHRAINDEAEVNRAEAHQVAGQSQASHHAGHGEQHRERNRQRHDERRAPVAEQQEQTPRPAIAPSNRFVSTVRMVRLTSTVRS
jgi:hypothetical protein